MRTDAMVGAGRGVVVGDEVAGGAAVPPPEVAGVVL
jgi:hypothetical protein